MEKKIDLCVQPGAFFQERVVKAKHRFGFETSQAAEYYVVDLLERFMLTSTLFNENKKTEQKDQEPLAILFFKAQDKTIDDAEKVKLLKKLGDTSLYISGFFGDSLNRKIIDLDYYRDMGAIAYRSLSQSVRDGTFQQLYQELHEKFMAFVDLLTAVSQEVFLHDNQNLLRLYEVYVRTGSELAKKQLADKGLSPNKNNKN